MNPQSFLTEKRIKRIKNVVQKRQFDLTVVLENIHDPHNIAAVMRTCDAVGISEIYVLLNDPRIDRSKYEFEHNEISSGSKKWVQVKLFENVNSLVKSLRPKYTKLLGTNLSEDAISLYDIDFVSQSVALVFGNEHQGLTAELQMELDGNFIIPQYGMVQSLNISVACAVSIYEALRQKEKVGRYNEEKWNNSQEGLFEHYVKVSKERINK